MALDESVRQFVNELLDLRLMYLTDRGGEPIPAGTIKMRLVRLWSYGGLLRGGVGRIESSQPLEQRLWSWFSSPKIERFDFTKNLGRYQVHLSSDEPQAHPEIGVPISDTTVAAGFGMISAGRMSAVPRRYSVPTDKILTQILSVPASVDRWMPYRPCDVVLKSGRRVDRVYVVPEEPHILMWGVWPENNGGEEPIRIDDLAEVHDSRHRLPVRFAQKLYAAGESGMGYTIFTVRFADGSHIAIQTGDAIDFIAYPAGKGPNDVVDVVPHAGRDDPSLRTVPAYYWCLHSG